MLVVGGYYRELCRFPKSTEIYGSGGRAALLLSSRLADVKFHTFCPNSHRENAAATFAVTGAEAIYYDTDHLITFSYLHPLAKPHVYPWPTQSDREISVSDDVILRFGMMEGEAVASADYAVYDPQSPDVVSFAKNGSTARHLALVLNQHEAHMLADRHGIGRGNLSLLCEAESAEVIVVKSGPVGAVIYENGRHVGTVSAYQADRVYKIGSGDSFSAAFTKAWAVERKSAVESADIASRSASYYCERRSYLQPTDEERQARFPSPIPNHGRVYIASPFFTTSELWLVEEIANALTSMGVSVFSPFHEVGGASGRSSTDVAAADLGGLDNCSAVLAVISTHDHGTLFEVGYANARGKPVVALYENPREADFTMFSGTGCEIVTDLATAVYKAAWASAR